MKIRVAANLTDFCIRCPDFIFCGNTGAGLGASRQTGWTARVATLLRQPGEYAGKESSVYIRIGAAKNSVIILDEKFRM